MKNRFLRDFVIMLLIVASVPCDWGIFAPLMTCMFVWAGDSRKKKIVAFIVNAVIVEVSTVVSVMYRASDISFIIMLFSFVFVLIAGFLIVFCYDEEKKSIMPEFSNKFFYWFYPVHLLVLWLVCVSKPLWIAIGAFFSELVG